MLNTWSDLFAWKNKNKIFKSLVIFTWKIMGSKNQQIKDSFEYSSTFLWKRWRYKSVNTLWTGTRCGTFVSHNFFCWKRFEFFLLSNFQKREGNRIMRGKIASSESTSRSSHPCAGENNRSCGRQVKTMATSHRKFCWGNQKVTQNFIKSFENQGLISQHEILKNHYLTKKILVAWRQKKESTQLS